MDLAEVIKYSNHIVYAPGSFIATKEGFCDACGGVSTFRYKDIISDELASQWKLTKAQQRAVSARESMYCLYCGCSFRLRMLARSIVRSVNESSPLSLEEAVNKGIFNDVSVAEINSCGVLHGILKSINSLSYSEFTPPDKTIAHQDITKLTYQNEQFDLVLTSDTLEHVPDIKAALNEIYRVLKPGGKHIFTVPILLNRATRERARLTEYKELEVFGESSYHGAGQPDYLVINEFGHQFIKVLEAAGFSVTLEHTNLDDPFEPTYVIVAEKVRKNETNKTIRKKIHIDKLNEKIVNTHLRELGFTKGVQLISTVHTWSLTPHQISKLRWLADKQELTEKHLSNITAINEAYLLELGKKQAYINTLESKSWGFRRRKLQKIIVRSLKASRDKPT